MTHIQAAADFIAHAAPANNEWGTACTMFWSDPYLGYAGEATGSCFFTLSLRQAYPQHTAQAMFGWWGMNSPDSPRYFDAITSGNGFERRLKKTEVKEGDVVVLRYGGMGKSLDGHTMMIEKIEAITPREPYPDTNGDGDPENDLEQWKVTVLDSVQPQNHHGAGDTRYNIFNPLKSRGGAGRGHIRIYSNPITHALAGHTWSTSSSSTFYPADGTAVPSTGIGKALVIGKFVPPP